MWKDICGKLLGKKGRLVLEALKSADMSILSSCISQDKVKRAPLLASRMSLRTSMVSYGHPEQQSTTDLSFVTYATRSHSTK